MRPRHDQLASVSPPLKGKGPAEPPGLLVRLRLARPPSLRTLFLLLLLDLACGLAVLPPACWLLSLGAILALACQASPFPAAPPPGRKRRRP